MSTESRELVIFATNDGNLYRQRIMPVIKNLALKKAKRSYDPEKSLILWKYVADDAARRYSVEFSTGKDSFNIFSPASRREAAKELAEYYQEEIDDYFENYPGELPKKYRNKNPVHTAKFDRCTRSVKRKSIRSGKGANAYVICSSALGYRESIAPSHRRRNPVSGFNLIARSNDARRAYYDGEFFNPSKSSARVFSTAAQAKKAANSLMKGKHLKPGWRLAIVPATFSNPMGLTGRDLYEQFHGETPQRVKYRKLPVFSQGVEIGPLVAVTYDTIRDGKIQRYEHEFSERASPLLVSSDSGRKVAVIGGDFQFTDRGFVDKPKLRK